MASYIYRGDVLTLWLWCRRRVINDSIKLDVKNVYKLRWVGPNVLHTVTKSSGLF